MKLDLERLFTIIGLGSFKWHCYPHWLYLAGFRPQLEGSYCSRCLRLAFRLFLKNVACFPQLSLKHDLRNILHRYHSSSVKQFIFDNQISIYLVFRDHVFERIFYFNKYSLTLLLLFYSRTDWSTLLQVLSRTLNSLTNSTWIDKRNCDDHDVEKLNEFVRETLPT